MKHAKTLLIKLTKTKHKERILKATREKQQVTASLSVETLQARREWQDIFSFKIDGEIKRFPDKQKLREVSTTKPAL